MLKDKIVAIGAGNERSSNIELYRIIVMLLIVAGHYVFNSGLIDVMDKNILSINTVFSAYLVLGVRQVLIVLY